MPALLAEAAEGRSSGARRMSDDAISVLIVAKDPISHAGVERQLVAVSEVTVLTPRSGRHPDIALVVADTVDDEVLGWIRIIRKHSLSRIVVVAGVTGTAVACATEAGANGVLPRSMADSRRLAWAIQKVHRGDSITLVGADESPEVTPSVASRASLSLPLASVALGAPRDPGGGTERCGMAVSERDREVLRLLAEGCDTGEIARTLAYSEPTIKNVIQRLFEQLRAKNRPHAVALALRLGII